MSGVGEADGPSLSFTVSLQLRQKIKSVFKKGNRAKLNLIMLSLSQPTTKRTESK